MKKYILIAFLTILTAVGSAHAQSVAISADVPFDFVVGNTTMHQGTYTIRPFSTTGENVLLRSADLKQSVFLSACNCVSSETAPIDGQFVFKKIGSQYYLWQIWTPGYTAGRELRVKISEKESAAVREESPTVILASIAR